MSRSTTYRPIELTAEERAELNRRAHARQLAEEILPELRTRWDLQLRRTQVSLGEHNGAGLERTAGLRQTLRQAGSLDEFRSAAAAVVETVWSSAPRREVRLPSSPSLGRHEPDPWSAGSGDTRLVEVLVEVEIIDVELDAVEHSAKKLDVSLATLAAARQLVEEARKLLTEQQVEGGAQRVALARTAVGRLRAEVDDARAAAECGKRATAAITATLSGLGFELSQSVTGRTVNISARAVDGRAADVEITGGTDAGQVLVTVDVDDPASAVPGDHPAAHEVCATSAAVAVEVHRDLGNQRGLAAGRVTTAGRPTRGGMSAPAKKRRRTVDNNAQRVRGVQ